MTEWIKVGLFIFTTEKPPVYGRLIYKRFG